MIYRSRRWPTTYPLRVSGPHGSASAQIIEISPGGLRLTAPGLNVDVGEPLTMILATGPLRGIVRWRRAGTFGIGFALPLGTDVLHHVTYGRYVPGARTGGTEPFGTQSRAGNPLRHAVRP